VSATLLDTQALLWLFDANSKLSPAALEQIIEPGAELYVSYASAWEIAIKHGNGKLQLPDQPEPFLLKHLELNKIRLLPISIASIFAAGRLPRHHKDPFDRLIAAQCLRQDLTLISIDTVFDSYGVRRVW
jgi:PIN domain nuclease of toxin-antitoxin system